MDGHIVGWGRGEEGFGGGNKAGDAAVCGRKRVESVIGDTDGIGEHEPDDEPEYE